jgi:hypothetical protein
MIDAEILARSLIGETLTTITGRPNTVVAAAGGNVTVATTRSPEGRPVAISWLQDVLDRLGVGEHVPIEPGSVGYRSAFLGAVLLTLPMIEITNESPPIAAIDRGYPMRSDVLSELQVRLGMYADLLEAGGPESLAPNTLRSLGIYGGASGVWNDAGRTRGIGDADSVTVGLLHTGRHYPDDLSASAVRYHYPDTDRQPGRDRAEIEATKAAGRFRLPVFVVLQHSRSREVRKGWVAAWDDEAKEFLVEFGPEPVRLPRGDQVDNDPFELFEDREGVFRRTRGRPNQQRFHLQVLQRYGPRCALCGSAVGEWLHAAHLAGDAERGASDPRNGLPFCSNHHAAFDRGLVAISPANTRVYVNGYSASELGITTRDLSHLPAEPAAEALQYRWDRRESRGWEPAD